MRIIILGPTASGKTELSIQLAEDLETSIISADSRQCFSMMDIGTAKPSKQELTRVRHFNISNLSLDGDDSAIKFNRRAEVWENEILSNSEHVIYVGGSTLHLTGLIQPFSDIPDSDPKNIAVLNQRIEDEGIESLFELLKSIDPEYIPKMDGMNRQRIIRALDVWMQTGKPFSSFHNNDKLKPDEDSIVFGLQHPREKLYARINKRVDLMIQAGLENEVEQILDSGFSPDLQALQTVGYREVIAHRNGEFDRKTMIEKIKTNTRRYAKRQLTWFRRWEFIHWLDADKMTTKELMEKIQSTL
ncbi:MAG: tRNA (adenosine(37)-N6)-dimethylallyltransferase MiaA [Balneolaceae bacterium]|nr:tRNA (adenosine(37)-N6)-dimethylallyltransferase MiaA [Balneolaceae bacterium]